MDAPTKRQGFRHQTWGQAYQGPVHATKSSFDPPAISPETAAGLHTYEVVPGPDISRFRFLLRAICECIEGATAPVFKLDRDKPEQAIAPSSWLPEAGRQILPAWDWAVLLEFIRMNSSTRLHDAACVHEQSHTGLPRIRKSTGALRMAHRFNPNAMQSHQAGLVCPATQVGRTSL